MVNAGSVPPGEMDQTTQELYSAGEEAARLANPTAVNDDSATVPTEYTVTNAPNPFNPSTKVRFTVVAEGAVSLAVYNLVGQQIRTLVSDTRQAGEYEVIWDGQDAAGNRMASGLYFAVMRAGGRTIAARMMLVR